MLMWMWLYKSSCLSAGQKAHSVLPGPAASAESHRQAISSTLARMHSVCHDDGLLCETPAQRDSRILPDGSESKWTLVVHARLLI